MHNEKRDTQRNEETDDRDTVGVCVLIMGACDNHSSIINNIYNQPLSYFQLILIVYCS